MRFVIKRYTYLPGFWYSFIVLTEAFSYFTNQHNLDIVLPTVGTDRYS